MKNYIVLHTHWDREWYFTTSDSLVLMDRTFKNIITELELYPEISFCLDGQYSVIEEFLNINPDLELKVKQLVEEKRLWIGPWYTQTDTQLVSGESIVRNLYYGMNKTIKRFGTVMRVGYLPDTFGFCHQMPEIYNLAGIDSAVFWRGADFSTGMKPYFKWRGAGGSTVKTINLFGGYGMAKHFDCSSDFVENTLMKIIENYRKLGIEGDLLIPVGNDQFEIATDVPQKSIKISKEYNIDIENLDFQKSIDSIFKQNNFDTYTCEFRETAYTRLHKSIGSVRYDLKKLNFEVEQLLINEVEPLFVIGKEFDINPSINLLYQAWALLFEGHAHDGICGCISDAVYEDMVNRIKRAKEIGLSLKNIITKQIALQLELDDEQILLINPTTQIKKYHHVSVYSHLSNVSINDFTTSIISTKEIAARDDALVETNSGNIYETVNKMYHHQLVFECELKPFDIKVLDVKPASIVNAISKSESNQIENENIAVSVSNDQICIKLQDRIFEDALKIIDIGNDGDTYDFSPLEGDLEIDYNVTNYITNLSGIEKQMTVHLSAKLPQTLEERINKVYPVESEIKLVFTITGDSDILGIKIVMENNVYSHKLTVRLASKKFISQTLSSSAYGEIVRDVRQDEEISDWESHHVEKPVSIETFDGFVKPVDQDITILSSWGKEYQAHQHYLDLTVFATTGELGKSNLLHRPGRASGDVTKKGHIKIDTPKAQCLGPVEFDFGLTLSSNDYFINMDKLKKFREHSVYYQAQEINKFEGRIDNKLMEYRSKTSSLEQYQPLHLETNSYISSIGLDLNSDVVVRGVANSAHYMHHNKELKSIDLCGNLRDSNFSKFSIFNYQLKGKDENNIK